MFPLGAPGDDIPEPPSPKPNDVTEANYTKWFVEYYEKGWKKGCEEGTKEGEEEGKKMGKRERGDHYRSAYESGYSKGYNDAMLRLKAAHPVEDQANRHLRGITLETHHYGTGYADWLR